MKRTITVPGPHGPLTVFEPDWCTHHSHDELDWRALTHMGDDFHITVNTPRGDMTLLTGLLFQQVWPGAGNSNDVMYALELGDGSVDCTPDQLRALYRTAVDQLRQLLDRADQLDVLRGGGQ